MWRFASSILLLTYAVPAGATDWRFAGSSSESVTWVDVSRIMRDGTRVRFWRDTRYKTPLPTSRANRIVQYQEVDCSERRYRSIRTTLYRSGTPLDIIRAEEEWDYAAPGTAIDRVLENVCKGNDFGGASVRAEDLGKLSDALFDVK